MTEEQLCEMLDFYESRISDSEDRILFSEANKAAKGSALRAAYLVLWACCTESLKQRFRELARRDSTANKVIEEISAREADQRPVGSYLMEQADLYGMISASGYKKLERVYSMQRVYSRASEEQPQLEDFVADAFAIVDSLLCRFSKLECRSASEETFLRSREITTLIDALKQQLSSKGSSSSSG